MTGTLPYYFITLILFGLHGCGEATESRDSPTVYAYFRITYTRDATTGKVRWYF